MTGPTKVYDLELSGSIDDIDGLNAYERVHILGRWHNVPIGSITLPVTNGRCAGRYIRQSFFDTLSDEWLKVALRCRLQSTANVAAIDPIRLFDPPDPEPRPSDPDTWPVVTVAVCTRDRVQDLRLCLEALMRLDYPALDVLVIDNAPGTNETAELVETYAAVRYVCEPRPGLDWARNRAILEARGEIIAYTDDDVIVDPGWIKAIVRLFVEEPAVMAITGLVVPYELETEAQRLFEQYGGFGRGFCPQWYQVNAAHYQRWSHHGSGRFGTGANMAYRCSLFKQIGYFDPALDVGAVTNGGGDLDMFFRVLQAGRLLVYEPKAIIRHRHRRTYVQLRTQLTNHWIGLFSHFTRNYLAYPGERLEFISLGVWWLWYGGIRRLLIALLRPGYFPRDLILAELGGALVGLSRYPTARQKADQIAEEFGPQALEVETKTHDPVKPITQSAGAIAIRTVDLDQPWQPLTDVSAYESVRVYIKFRGGVIGYVNINNNGQAISVIRLQDEIIYGHGDKILAPIKQQAKQSLQTRLGLPPGQQVSDQTALPENSSPSLPPEVSVSIVLATYDRPDDLRRCLTSLLAQETNRSVEIIVVDNHPASGLTPPVIAEFPTVVLVDEPRRGLAYARNAGFAACRGNIAAATDDDVIIPPDWLEKLIAPFARPEVMIVTGNVLPLELETKAQRIFEYYGGLGRGFAPFEVDRDWFDQHRFRAVPTWSLGATANAAFRTTIFARPEIGLMDEALGPGMPSGVGEDTYLFYKVLKAGYTIVYEPKAHLWHKHRRQLTSLRNQLYDYSKGHVAYHLTTLLRDSDWRALFHIVVDLSIWRAKQMLRGLIEMSFGHSQYPFSLILLEIYGNLVGPWALWQSRRRVRREGQSSPYSPIAQRASDRQTLDFE